MGPAGHTENVLLPGAPVLVEGCPSGENVYARRVRFPPESPSLRCLRWTGGAGRVYSRGVDPSPDLFQYLDYRRFLADWFAARKAANPRFSHRAFARKAGQGSPSLLLHVIEGKRNLTPATAESFTRAMALRPDETEFFHALVHLAQAEAVDDRNRAWERVRATRRFREARRLEGDGFEYLSAWYYPAIRELALCDGFRPDPDWIAATLRPRITVSQARKGLDLLLSLGLLRREEDGRVVPAEASVATPHEVGGLAALNYHRGMSERAREAIAEVPRDERHYCAVTVSIPLDLVPRLKRELDALQERLLDLCDSHEGPRDHVYQVNLQLFPLSVPARKER